MIVEVGQEEVNSPPEVQAKVNQAQQENKKSVLLLIDRQGDLRFVALRFPERRVTRTSPCGAALTPRRRPSRLARAPCRSPGHESGSLRRLADRAAR